MRRLKHPKWHIRPLSGDFTKLRRHDSTMATERCFALASHADALQAIAQELRGTRRATIGRRDGSRCHVDQVKRRFLHRRAEGRPSKLRITSSRKRLSLPVGPEYVGCDSLIPPCMFFR